MSVETSNYLKKEDTEMELVATFRATKKLLNHSHLQSSPVLPAQNNILGTCNYGKF